MGPIGLRADYDLTTCLTAFAAGENLTDTRLECLGPDRNQPAVVEPAMAGLLWVLVEPMMSL